MELLGKPTITPLIFTAGKISVVLILASPFLAMIQPGWFYSSMAGWLRLVAWFFYAVSAIIVVVASMELGKSLRVGLPSGKTGLKTGGLYSLSRNPIYATFYPWCLAVAVLAPHPIVWAFSLFSLYVHHRIILGEEKFLAGRFGRQWDKYRSKVGRYA